MAEVMVEVMEVTEVMVEVMAEVMEVTEVMEVMEVRITHKAMPSPFKKKYVIHGNLNNGGGSENGQ